jgi:hypothetical protein
LYHVFPIDCEMLWFNLEQLARRLRCFNHKVVFNIVSLDDAEARRGQPVRGHRIPADEMRRLLASHVLGQAHPQATIEYAATANRPSEAQAFFDVLLPRVVSDREGEYTFFAHTKGASRPATSALFQWVEWMYYWNLHDLGRLLEVLSPRSSAGCFRRTTRFPNGEEPSSKWHYSGTFFWLNHRKIFAGDAWREHVSTRRWGAEAWLGKFVPYDQSVCLFGDNHGTFYAEEAVVRFRKSLRSFGFAEGASPCRANTPAT